MALRDTVFEKRTVQVYVPNSSVPTLKKAAREMGIDVFDGDFDEQHGLQSLHFLICDYGQLVSIAYIAGIESAYTQMIAPVKEVMGVFETKVEEFKKK
jgi:hypothetical protein